jgi:hypothetical protein
VLKRNPLGGSRLFSASPTVREQLPASRAQLSSVGDQTSFDLVLVRDQVLAKLEGVILASRLFFRSCRRRTASKTNETQQKRERKHFGHRW